MRPSAIRLIPVDNEPKVVEQRIEGDEGQSLSDFVLERLGWIAGTMIWWGCTQQGGTLRPHNEPIITLFEGNSPVRSLGYQELFDHFALDAHNSTGEYLPHQIRPNSV